jgi:hypothetical protein
MRDSHGIWPPAASISATTRSGRTTSRPPQVWRRSHTSPRERHGPSSAWESCPSTGMSRPGSRARSTASDSTPRSSGSGSDPASFGPRSTSSSAQSPTFASASPRRRASSWRRCDLGCAASAVRWLTECFSTGCCPIRSQGPAAGYEREPTRPSAPHRSSPHMSASPWALSRCSDFVTKNAATAPSTRATGSTSRP